MKAIILFILLPFAAICQRMTDQNGYWIFTANNRTGTFSMNGVIVTRTDSLEIADFNGKLDTCRVTWLSDKVYTVEGKEGVATVTITASGKWGYKGYAVMGCKRAKIEAIRVCQK